MKLITREMASSHGTETPLHGYYKEKEGKKKPIRKDRAAYPPATVVLLIHQDQEYPQKKEKRSFTKRKAVR